MPKGEEYTLSIWGFDEDYEEDYEIEDDGFVTKDEDLMVEEPNFAPGFQRNDKPYLEGYCKGLEVAMGFCDNEQDSRAVKMQIEKVQSVLKDEVAWMF